MMLWLLIAGLLVLASIFLIYPFVKAEHSAKGEVLQANIQIFRDQQYQLDAQLEQKQISQAQYQQLLAEAKQLLLSNTGEQTTEQATSSERRQAKGLLPVLIILVPCFCFAVYHSIGASADQRIIQLIQQASESSDKLQVVELQTKLYKAIEERAQQRPDNIYYWMNNNKENLLEVLNQTIKGIKFLFNRHKISQCLARMFKIGEDINNWLR